MSSNTTVTLEEASTEVCRVCIILWREGGREGGEREELV